ncbi:MAG TPA: FtsQ-type POTRA domain-containing protein [Candidatus Aminicenantes bacterium]|nr:FtsQ-type POTRA domain-containing protein [Candidatus Aminicenantes bacterium]
MATMTGEIRQGRRPPLSARRLFLRPGDKPAALRKNRRRRILKVRHVALLLALQAVLFLALREAVLFLITWEELEIREVQVVCAEDDLRRALESHFAAPRLGNILLCDLEALRAQVRRLAWVKDASVEKVLPSALHVSVVLRAPFALLERGGGLWLADEEGRVLEPVYAIDEYDLPVVSDETGFGSGFFDKWDAASRCLKSLPRTERDRLLAVRTNDYGTLELAFEDDPVRIVVSTAAPAAGLEAFRGRRTAWEARFGPLAVADLSYVGRIYLRPAEPPPSGDGLPQPDKGE